MRRIFAIGLLAAFVGPSFGCFVHTHDRGPRRTVYREAPRRGGGGCGPAYHWEGGVCVHNGKAKGHYKKK